MKTFMTILLILIASSLLADVTPMMNYQGILTDDTGQPVADDIYEIVFRIYTQETGGSPVWSETQNVSTTDGIFHVLLGSLNPITNFPSDNAWLAMRVESNPEMLPRKRIASVGYSFISEEALHSINADNASFADDANHANTSSNSDALQGYGANDFVLNSEYVEPISIGLPETTFNTPANSWVDIRTLTISISAPMNLFCFGFFRRVGDIGPIAIQFILENSQGNVIDWGERSYRNPPNVIHAVSSDIAFNVSPGTYTVILCGITTGAGTIEEVYINMIGLPQTNTENFSTSVPSIQRHSWPFTNGPLTDK